MSDRATRIVAAVALGASLLSLSLSAVTAMTVSRQDEQLRELAESYRARLLPEGGDISALPMHSPPPELETEP